MGFEVNTQPPEPTLVAPPSPSNNVNPGFSGTASEATPVTVHVFEGHDGSRKCLDNGLGRDMVDQRPEQGAAEPGSTPSRRMRLRSAASATPKAGAMK